MHVYTNKEWRNPTSIKTRVRWCVSTTETLVVNNVRPKIYVTHCCSKSIDLLCMALYFGLPNEGIKISV